MGLSRGRASIRVLHVRRGRPLTSAEQEPHLPALQFQRTAKSGAWCAWIWWSASSTTIPGAIGTRYVAGCPPSRFPRNTSKIASAICDPPRSFSFPICLFLFLFGNQLPQVVGHFRYWGLPEGHRGCFAEDHIVLRPPDWVEAGIVNPAVSAAAFLTSKGAPGHCLGNR